MSLLRSLLFYAAFYIGSVYHVAGSVILAAMGSKRTFRKVVNQWPRWHRWCVRNILGITIRIEGDEPQGPVLVAIKHESFFEAIDMPALLSNPVVFAKAELMRIPVWGRAARLYGLVSVEREQGAKALRNMISEARRLTADGRPLAIFPEGTRVRHGTRPALQSGFAGLYKLLDLPVVPVAVMSGPLYHRWIKRRGTIVMRFGEVIPAGLPRPEIEARVVEAINALNPGQAA